MQARAAQSLTVSFLGCCYAGKTAALSKRSKSTPAAVHRGQFLGGALEAKFEFSRVRYLKRE